MKRLNLISAVIAINAALVTTSYADQKLDQMSEKLIQLRGEVEQLNSEISFLKDEHKQEMNFLWTQKNETQSEIERNKRVLERLTNDLQEAKQKSAETGINTEELLPEFKQAVLKVKTYIDQSLPFKQQERIASLLEIEEQVNQKLIPVQRGFNKLWAFVEDEIRLTKESGLYQSSVQVDGQDRKQLVDVARIGMMQMYFLTQENQVGMLTGSTGNWSYKMIDGADQQQQVTYLFESLQKQVRTGLFPLPTQANQ
jgi:chromosome segregation ATPase